MQRLDKNTMRGLKIQHKWIREILSGEKTMDVRSVHYEVLGQRIALGNSDNGLIEGYATVQEVIKIPYSEISNCGNQHRATEWLKAHYRGGEIFCMASS
jgi:hypothetical protein